MEHMNPGASPLDAVLTTDELWCVVDRKVASGAIAMHHIARVLATVTMVLEGRDVAPTHVIMVADALVRALRSTVDDECKELDGLCAVFELVNHPDIGPLN